MRKSTSKQVVKVPTKSKAKPKPETPKRALSPDDQLTEYLNTAEDALIGAVNLFSGPRKVERRVEYRQRLERAQEAITGLHREELVRKRGPIRNRGSK